MSASKNRPVWDGLPAAVRAAVERLVGGQVVEARSCPGGFSPGFASVLTRADGHRVFVKAVDAVRWPGDAALHRAEAEVGAALPVTAGAPRLLGGFDDGHWVGLAFEAVDGVEPRQPWDAVELDRVVTALLARDHVPAPAGLSREHPRLGGWTALADQRARVAEHSTWAADHLPRLVELEREGLAAAEGDSLVHFDLYPHNVLVGGGLAVMPPGQEAIATAKRRLGLGALPWLARRLRSR